MTQMTEISGDIVERIPVPAEGTAGNAGTYALMVAEKNLTVVSARWIPNGAVTGANTNNFALAVVNKGAAGAGGGQVTTPLTYASGENAAVAVPEVLPIGTAPDVAAGDVLVLARTVNGTGLASPAGVVELKYRFR